MKKYIILLFLCLSLTTSGQQYRYWFDRNVDAANQGEATAGRMHLDADISSLTYGFHTLNFALIDDLDGSMTSVRFASFLKGMKAQKYIYWFDRDLSSAISGSVSAGMIHLEADLTQLSEGFHTLNYALFGNDGSMTSVRFVTFLKSNGLTAENLRMVYQLDEGEALVSDAPQMGSNTYRFDIDATSLEIGEHTISYMLTDGSYTYATGQATFVKQQINGIDVITATGGEVGKAYNLNGQQVQPIGKNIYIINGKKFIVK